ncbi:MAG: hypothetical protein ACPIOQ_21100 [Promethearchaeia archaeon]
MAEADGDEGEKSGIVELTDESGRWPMRVGSCLPACLLTCVGVWMPESM